MIIDFDWLSQPGVKNVINMIYTIIDIIRIVVPIILILMTTIDISKKIIDPNDKEGQKKIMIRAIAAIIVFFVPTIISLVFRLFGIDNNVDINTNTNTNISTPIPTIVPTKTPTPTIVPIKTPLPTIVPTKTPSPTLNDLNIITCPDTSNLYKIGDVIKLVTDIPSSYNGEIIWSANDANSVKITYSDNKKVATFEIIDQPRLATVWVTVVAGGKANTCYFHIRAVDNLEIINCPNNQIYHVGDKFVLKSNLPSYYKGVTVWQSETSPNTFKFTPSADGREAVVEILQVPKDKYAFVGFGADSKSTACKINIE